MISLKITAQPRSLKNLKPIGETSIGRHGKANRSALKGAKSATPEPPFVSISRSGCENVASEKKQTSAAKEKGVFKNRRAIKAMSAPKRIAKRMECVKPRWLNIPPRAAPNE